ncbi:anhydro-N-acetylmuramic acid kinase [Legionella lansingensis]|uniref:Anhydro-N-acetylmuramic acid kinase n=1 Tax=Legionella lansingensis TaxID=45067 RepID=A0A0W0VQ76_9GAMM|nr:anhydro-N-acetylmuramic acid kinase [Legionella lansingensis]KTD22315.1 anhydro-N-acetylmuramic acid kinase [Legionella lansingensis]SNV50733.1 anhydro-N-acetylmuramic acid kinase [Legionella lansingensis]
MTHIKANGTEKLYIGLMSGTSMDGIDAALVDLTTNRFVAGLTRPYSPEAKNFLGQVLSGHVQSLKVFSQLNTILGREFAQAALELMATAKVSATQVHAIGSHGQTLCHDATAYIPYTVQLGCAHTIAELTGVTVVADFRTRDLVVGGQGAPFAPIYHQALFAKYKLPLMVINIGGISNVTYLSHDVSAYGYDVGPGNCLMDAWIKQHLELDCDINGNWAASGSVIAPLLDKLASDPFFTRPQPKSIGKEYFSLEWLTKQIDPGYKPVDVQATLLMLTANVIAQAVQAVRIKPTQVLICGGGTHNVALMQAIRQCLPGVDVTSTSIYGIDPDFIEAAMFAWFAEKTLNYTPLDMSKITGARNLAILGTIYPRGIDKGN